jgi:hypothetical protein
VSTATCLKSEVGAPAAAGAATFGALSGLLGVFPAGRAAREPGAGAAK